MYAVKNKYYKHSKLDEQCFRRILELFAMDLTAVQCANLTGVNVRSVNTIFLKLRDRISQWSEVNASGTPGLNAQLSEGTLVTGTSGRREESTADSATESEAVSHKSEAVSQKSEALSQKSEAVSYIDSANDGIVGLRLFINSDQVYCALLNRKLASSAQQGMQSAMARSGSGAQVGIEPGSQAASRWNEYQIGIDLKRDMRFKLKSATFQQAYHAGETDRIDAFGRFMRLRLGKFKGLRREKFYFHLKESEYRYNHRRYELYALLLGMLGETPIE